MDCAMISQPKATPPSTGHGVEKRIGNAKKFVHKVQIHLEVKPVHQKLWRLSLSVREAVTSELNELEKQEIIERIESSKSTIVLTSRKMAGFACVNMMVPKNH